MIRIGSVLGRTIAVCVLAAAGSAAARGCAEYGAPSYTAPARAGDLRKAWPLAAPDNTAWGHGRARVRDRPGGLELEVFYPEGSINPGNPRAPEGGLGFYDHLAIGDRLSGCLSYEVRFQKGFRFAKGGKLPGLWGGGGVSGCTKHRKLGFSTRFMWSKYGDGFVYAYLASRTSRCGEAIGFDRRHKRIKFQPGRWHKIEQQVTLNTPGKHDGVLKVWFDGQLMIDERDIRYRDRASVRIDGLMFSTFFGGNSRGNASPRNQKTWFRNFEYRALSDAAAALPAPRP